MFTCGCICLDLLDHFNFAVWPLKVTRFRLMCSRLDDFCTPVRGDKIKQRLNSSLNLQSREDEITNWERLLWLNSWNVYESQNELIKLWSQRWAFCLVTKTNAQGEKEMQKIAQIGELRATARCSCAVGDKEAFIIHVIFLKGVGDRVNENCAKYFRQICENIEMIVTLSNLYFTKHFVCKSILPYLNIVIKFHTLN